MAALPSLAAADNAAPTVDELIARPSLCDAAISPDGGCAAVLGVQRGGARSAVVLLFDTANMAAPPLVVPIGDCEVERVDWASNQRLLVWLLLDKNKRGQETGISWKGQVLTQYTRRVLAMDRAGSNQVLLFANDTSNLKLNRNLGSVVDYVSDDDDCILMKAWSVRESRLCLYKVNVHTGEATVKEIGDHDTDDWVTQRGVAIMRVDSVGRTVSLYVRAPGETTWKFFQKFRRNETEKLDGIDFVGATEDPAVSLIVTTAEGEDLACVRTFDARTLKVGEKVASRPDRDMSGCMVDRHQKLVATSWWQDKLSYDFKNPALAKHYRGVCAYFGNDCNVAIIDISDDHQKLVVRASGPRHAGSFWIYDRVRAKLEPLGAAYAKLGQRRLASMEILRFDTRDGLPMTAYLTRPPGIGDKRPLVVMPHGGPEARDTYDYDPLLQTLAAEGWMVLQVNFRGSNGYGRAFVEAGRKHWGDLMQNDVEDALKVVIGQGSVDESRIAICGISYGGYAALMGAVKTPDRYKAVVAIAGDSDLLKTLAYTREDEGSDSIAYEYWRKTIGDPSADRDALIAASPARRAQEFRAPVLLMHGELDGIVRVEQSRIMRDALKAAKKSVDYFEAVAEGHPLWREENNAIMTHRMLDHIRKAFA